MRCRSSCSFGRSAVTQFGALCSRYAQKLSLNLLSQTLAARLSTPSRTTTLHSSCSLSANRIWLIAGNLSNRTQQPKHQQGLKAFHIKRSAGPNLLQYHRRKEPLQIVKGIFHRCNAEWEGGRAICLGNPNLVNLLLNLAHQDKDKTRIEIKRDADELRKKLSESLNVHKKFDGDIASLNQQIANMVVENKALREENKILKEQQSKLAPQSPSDKGPTPASGAVKHNSDAPTKPPNGDSPDPVKPDLPSQPPKNNAKPDESVHKPAKPGESK